MKHENNRGVRVCVWFHICVFADMKPSPSKRKSEKDFDGFSSRP